jgi:hypothetical protein
MLEPDAAFFKLHMARAQLIRWLDAPVPLASCWTDWRNIGGQYYFDEGVQDIKDIPDREMADKISECDGELRRYATARDAVWDILKTGEPPFLKRAVYNAGTEDFIAGSLTYAENLIPYMVFYAVVRGAGAFLGAGGYGIAVIHDYVLREDTLSAMRLGPGAQSEFMTGTERESAAGAFQGIADEMSRYAKMHGEERAPLALVIDELDTLK